jgi:EAL domain-containing protein (putative c-di-GMP-specific phosphodiesterase class I)
MTVVAEGIEKKEQLDELIGLGCDVGQGFYFSRPVDAALAELQLESSTKGVWLQYTSRSWPLTTLPA